MESCKLNNNNCEKEKEKEKKKKIIIIKNLVYEKYTTLFIYTYIHSYC